MNTRHSLIAGFSSIAALSIGASTAWGQNALGGGDALDRGLQVGAAGRNAAGPIPNYRDRNLLITGDVIGGRGFRGSVGYSAAEDFRGVLGSNETFRFRADSAISSPQFIQMGSAFEQLRFGQQMGLIEYRRSGSGDPAAMNAQLPVGLSSEPARLRVDRAATSVSSALAPQMLVEPRVVGSMYDNQGQLLYFNASNVRGITLDYANQNVSSVGLSTYDGMRVRQDLETGAAPPRLGAPFATDFQDVTEGTAASPKPGTSSQERPEQIPGAQPRTAGDEQPRGPDDRPSNAVPGRIEAGADTNVRPDSSSALQNRRDSRTGPERVERDSAADYDEILRRVAERYAAAQTSEEPNAARDVRAQLNQEYKQLRERLRDPRWQTPGRADEDSQIASDESQPTLGTRQSESLPSAVRHPGDPRPERPAGSTIPQPESTEQGASARRDQKEPERPEGPEPLGGQRAMTLEDFGVVLRHGHRIDRLSAGSNDRFNEVLAVAEQKLREGDYFTAERRFEHALRFTPGHPLATAGLAHAQLGAGLFLSSSFTLRNLFTNQPEMIDVQYSPDLLPNAQRMSEAITKLKTRLQGEKDLASYGMLLAYVGHQTGDQSLVEQGLNQLSQSDPGNALLPLLRSIWQDEVGENR